MTNLTIYAVEEAEINNSQPDRNYSNRLSNGVQAGFIVRRLMVKFDLSGLSEAFLQSAIMKGVHTDSLPLDNYHRDHLTQRVTSAWSEATVTWNTMPAVTSQNSIVTHHDVTKDREVESYDVTAMVRDALAEGKTEVSFMVQDTDETGFTLYYVQYESPLTLELVYTSAPKNLTVTSSPIAGVPIKINGISYITPQTITVEQGSHTVEAEPQITV